MTAKSNNIRNRHSSLTALPDFGKVPPQANDMEEAVLGAIMLEKDALLIVIEILKPESFYREAHQKIYSTIFDLAKRNNSVDIFTVTEELRAHHELDSVGGPVYITTLSSKVVSAANVEYHAMIVAQKHFQRELIRISTELQTRAFDDTYDISELLEFAEMSFLEISGRIFRKKATRLGVLIDIEINIFSKIQKGEKNDHALRKTVDENAVVIKHRGEIVPQ